MVCQQKNFDSRVMLSKKYYKYIYTHRSIQMVQIASTRFQFHLCLGSDPPKEEIPLGLGGRKGAFQKIIFVFFP